MFENDPEGYQIATSYAGGDFDKRRTVTHTVFNDNGFEYTLEQFQETINEAIAKIPEAYRKTALVVLDDDYESSSYLTISYRSPESDEAFNKRMAGYEKYVAEKRSGERAAYERLKAKFEKPNSPWIISTGRSLSNNGG